MKRELGYLKCRNVLNHISTKDHTIRNIHIIPPNSKLTKLLSYLVNQIPKKGQDNSKSQWQRLIINYR